MEKPIGDCGGITPRVYTILYSGIHHEKYAGFVKISAFSVFGAGCNYKN
jgi:hypothetical protein